MAYQQFHFFLANLNLLFGSLAAFGKLAICPADLAQKLFLLFAALPFGSNLDGLVVTAILSLDPGLAAL
jgi:hypothetical protein